MLSCVVVLVNRLMELGFAHQALKALRGLQIIFAVDYFKENFLQIRLVGFVLDYLAKLQTIYLGGDVSFHFVENALLAC